MSEYKPGDVANGHVLTDQGWVPLAQPHAQQQMAPPYVYPQPVQPTSSKKTGLIVGSSVVAGLLVIGAIAAGSGDGSTASANGAESSGTETSSTQRTTSDGLVEVNDWRVKVVSVEKDASAAIEAENEFNEDPDIGYSIVVLEGVNGAKSVKDLSSFTVELQGADKVIYDDESLFMVMPTELASEVAPGGTARAQFVIDAPDSAFGPGAVLLVDGVPVPLA